MDRMTLSSQLWSAPSYQQHCLPKLPYSQRTHICELIECFTKDLAAWVDKYMGQSPYLSLAHNPAVVPLPEIPSIERMQKLVHLSCYPKEWQENPSSFLQLLDIAQSHTLFNYKAVNAEKWPECGKNNE